MNTLSTSTTYDIVPRGEPAVQPATEPSVLATLVDDLLQHARLFFGVWLAVLLVGALLVLLLRPVHRAEALLQIDGRAPRALVASLAHTQAQAEPPSGQVQGEIEILRSRSLVEKAIARTAGDVEVREVGLGPWLSRFGEEPSRLRLVHLRVPPASHDRPLWLIAGEDSQWTLHDADGAELARGQVGAPTAFTVAGTAGSLQLDTLQARPGTRFRLTARSVAEVHDDLLRRLKVDEAGRQSGVVRLSLDDPDPVFATAFLDTLISAYLANHLEVHTAQAGRGLAFLEGQLPLVKRELERAEEALDKFRAGAGTVNLGQENESALRRIGDLERERVALQLRQQELLQRLGPRHPAAIALRRQLADVAQDLQRELGRIRESPRNETDVQRLQREVQTNAQLYTALLNNAQELRVSQAGVAGNARLVDAAALRARPVSPRASLLLPAAAGLGLVLALGAVLMARRLKPTLRSADELESCTGLQTAVTVPFSAHQRALMRSRRLRIWQGRARPLVLAAREPDEPAVESLRSLRNRLEAELAAGADGRAGCSRLLVTAATTDAGKSFVAANLSALTAATGQRVLLLDLDLRAPRQQSYFGRSRRRPGLVDVLQGRCNLADAIVRDALPGLDLLLRGAFAENAGELLLMPRFEALMDELAASYRRIVIDSAPVLPVADALAVGRFVDAACLVVRSEHNSATEVRDAVRRLAGAGIGVSALVLNGMRRARVGGIAERRYVARPQPVHSVAPSAFVITSVPADPSHA
jgi:tyrosine-protein kinase Etk/Wzc